MHKTNVFDCSKEICIFPACVILSPQDTSFPKIVLKMFFLQNFFQISNELATECITVNRTMKPFPIKHS